MRCESVTYHILLVNSCTSDSCPLDSCHVVKHKFMCNFDIKNLS